MPKQAKYGLGGVKTCYVMLWQALHTLCIIVTLFLSLQNQNQI